MKRELLNSGVLLKIRIFPLLMGGKLHLFVKHVKYLFRKKVEIPFDSVRQVESGFSEIRLGLNWG